MWLDTSCAGERSEDTARSLCMNERKCRESAEHRPSEIDDHQNLFRRTFRLVEKTTHGFFIEFGSVRVESDH